MSASAPHRFKQLFRISPCPKYTSVRGVLLNRVRAKLSNQKAVVGVENHLNKNIKGTPPRPHNVIHFFCSGRVRAPGIVWTIVVNVREWDLE